MSNSSFLSGQFLVAMPAMTDPRFHRSVVYLCAHNADGAMGLVVNRLIETVSFAELMKQLEIPLTLGTHATPAVHYGGPVESGRGFVLHSTDYQSDSTVTISQGIRLTATLDVLRVMASGRPPQQCLFTLGYAGWGAGQLDRELLENAWLPVPATPALLFETPLAQKWEKILGHMGVSPMTLSTDAGHA